MPEVSVDVLAFEPVMYETEAEKFVEEFRNSKERTQKVLEQLLEKNNHSPQMWGCEHLPDIDTALNWNFDNEMYTGFIVFWDGSIAAFETDYTDVCVHNYLK